MEICINHASFTFWWNSVIIKHQTSVSIQRTCQWSLMELQKKKNLLRVNAWYIYSLLYCVPRTQCLVQFQVEHSTAARISESRLPFSISLCILISFERSIRPLFLRRCFPCKYYFYTRKCFQLTVFRRSKRRPRSKN